MAKRQNRRKKAKTMKEIKGVDISYVQEGIDYKKLADIGVKFAIIRLGFGSKEDVTAAGHIKGCIDNGIDYGFYWYSYAVNKEMADEEIRVCIETLDKYKKPAYPVFFDMEEKRQIDTLTSEDRTNFAINFCEAVKSAGYPCGIYANPSWMENYYKKERLVGKYDIWLAHWTGSPTVKSRYDYGQTMWQWGLDRIGNMNVDGNICFVDYPAITSEFYGDDMPEEEDKPEKIFLKDEAVMFKNAPLYISSTAKKKSNKVNGTYYIHSVNTINGRIRITTPKGNEDVTGWVNISDCLAPLAEKKATVKKGDIVRVSPEAKYWDNGLTIPSWVYDVMYFVSEVHNGRAVIGEYKNDIFYVTGAIQDKYLIPVNL